MKYITNTKLVDLRFNNGMLILPWFYFQIASNLNSQKYAGEGVKPKPLLKRIFNILKEWKHLRTPKRDILIFSDTLFNTKNDKGQMFNMLHGYYYNLYPDDTLMIEDGDLNNEWRKTELYSCVSHINTFFLFWASLFASFLSRIKTINNADYQVLIDEYPELFSKRTLVFSDYYSNFYQLFLKIMLKKVQPKVILINCGSYGRLSGCICKVAHDLNIKIIEPQHGLVYNHAAYSAPDFILSNKEYMQYMPDMVYTFGDFWSKCIDWRYEKISVGNPCINEFAKKYSHTQSYIHDILVISQPNNKEHQRSFVIELAKLIPNISITIRFHPIEDANYEKTFFSDYPNINFSDSSQLLYKDMCSSKYVLGWYSTCLYELLAFKRKPIIVDCPMSQKQVYKDVGVWVYNAEDVVDYINKDIKDNCNNFEMFWKQNFEANVSEHINKLLTGK